MNLNVRVDVYFHGSPAGEVPDWLSPLIDLINAVKADTETIMANQAQVQAQLDAISADVRDTDTVVGSLEQILTNFAARVAALEEAAKNAEVPQAIVDQISALGTAVTQGKARLVADVVANTPAAPTP